MSKSCLKYDCDCCEHKEYCDNYKSLESVQSCLLTYKPNKLKKQIDICCMYCGFAFFFSLLSLVLFFVVYGF